MEMYLSPPSISYLYSESHHFRLNIENEKCADRAKPLKFMDSIKIIGKNQIQKREQQLEQESQGKC